MKIKTNLKAGGTQVATPPSGPKPNSVIWGT
jgi:hypothetical protein